MDADRCPPPPCALLVVGRDAIARLPHWTAHAAQLAAKGAGRVQQLVAADGVASRPQSEGWSAVSRWAELVACCRADQVLLVDAQAEFTVDVLETFRRESAADSGAAAHLLVSPRPAARSWSEALRLRSVEAGSRLLWGTAASPVRPAMLCLPRATLARLATSELPLDSIPAVRAWLRAEGETVPESHWGLAAAGAAPHEGLRWQEAAQQFLHTVRAWWRILKFPAADRAADHPHPLGWWAWPLLLLVAVLTLSLNLRYPLFEPDEARNAQLALNIVHSGQWLALELAGEPYWDKPPLVPWLIATSYLLFGESEWATRLPGNLAGLAVIACVFGLGRRFVGPRAAWLAALGLALSCGFTVAGRYVTMDSVLALSVTLTLWFAYMACEPPRFRQGWWLASAVAGGLGMLIKGPIVAVLTLPVLIAFHLLEKNGALLSVRRWVHYLAVVLLIAGPWYLATGLVQPEFLVYFFWRHNVVRFSDAFNHAEPWWYYLPVLFVVLFPVSYLLPTLVRVLGSNRAQFRQQRSRQVGFLVLAAAWVVLFFSLSQSKLPTYILPAFPPLALLLGFVLERFVLGAASLAAESHWVRWIPCRATRLILGLYAVGSVAYGGWLSSPSPSGWAVLVGLGGVLVIITLLAGSPRRSPQAGWVCLAVATLAWTAWANAALLPAVSAFRSVHQALHVVRERPEYQHVPVVFYCHESYGSGLWLEQEGCPEFSDDQRHRLREYLIEHRQVLLVSRQEPLEVVQASLPWPLSITKVPGARHLYLCAERDPRNHEPQVAERYRPAEVIWR